jgi:hypothetical protein
MPEIVYMPSSAVIVFSTAPPPTGYAHAHMLPISAPLTAAVTVPEMLVLAAIAALTSVAGDVWDVETVAAPDIDDDPVGVPLYHCVT